MRSLVSSLLALFLISSSSYSQTLFEVDQTVSPWSVNNNEFGYSLAYEHPYVFVGDPTESFVTTGGQTITGVGRVAVYKVDTNSQWQLIQNLLPDTLMPGYEFGTSISVDGNRMVASTNSTVLSYELNSSGSWAIQQVVHIPGPQFSSGFGESTALEDSILVVGVTTAPVYNSAGTSLGNLGAACIYKLDPNGSWQFDHSLNDTSATTFGCAVAISGDWLLIGAKGSSVNGINVSGKAFFYKKDPSNVFDLEQSFIGFPTTSACLGSDVDIQGERAVVAAHGTSTYLSYGPSQQGRVYTLDWDSNSSSWVYNDVLYEGVGLYGYSVSMDDSRLIVGSPYHYRTNPYRKRTGRVFIYDQDTSTYQWSNSQELASGSLDSNQFFGMTVAGSHSKVVVGECPKLYITSNGGKAYYYSDSCAVVVWDSVEVCGQAYSWRDGNIYSVSGDSASFLVQASFACDTLYRLSLDLHYPDSTQQIINSCEPYTWVDGVTYYESTDTASITLTNSVTGCDSVVFLDLHINAPDSTVNQADSVLTSNDSLASYQWLDCNDGMSAISGATGRVFTPAVNGSYAVWVTRSGCSDTSACFTIEGIGLKEEVFTMFSIYPNPNEGSFTILSEGNVRFTMVRIIDRSGKVVYMDHPDLQSEVRVEADLPTGVYTIMLIDDAGVVRSGRLVILE